MRNKSCNFFLKHLQLYGLPRRGPALFLITMQDFILVFYEMQGGKKNFFLAGFGGFFGLKICAICVI